MRDRFVVLFLLVGVALAPGLAAAQGGESSLEQIVVEMAHTRAEHQALADYYTEKAADARKLASRHQSMGRAYLGGKGMNKQAFTNHCRRIAEQQEAMAKEYDALAKLHAEEGKKAGE
jgi:hypothetical protein